MERNLIMFKNFINFNVESKKLIQKMGMDLRYSGDEEYLVKYSDYINECFPFLKKYILMMADIYFKDDVSYLSQYLDKIKLVMEKSGCDKDKLRDFYQVYLSDMSKDFVKKVGENCKGYYGYSQISIKDAKTVNEIIHYMHAYVINNEKILSSIPPLKEYNKDEISGVVLRGDNSQLGNIIYDNLSPDQIDFYMDIVCYGDDKAILLVRDVAHALSIQIKKYEGGYFVEYFVPKICNVEMVNKLPGVTKVVDDSSYTIGQFEIAEEDFPTSLYQFVKMVPTDADMLLNKGR